MTRVAIIVLNWNGASDSIKCAESLLSQSLKPDIILVDNFSSDDSVEKLEKFASLHPGSIHFIKNSVNSGFAGGNNFGISYALERDYGYIGSLNPDAKADKKWVENLVAEISDKEKVGIVTGLLEKADKSSIDSTGEQYSIWGVPSPRLRGQPIDQAPTKAEYIFGSTGGGFIARAELFREIGMFDEKFFMYFEDVDLCFRAQLAGYKVRYTPEAIAYHKISASTNKVPGLATTQTFKNLPVLFLKNVPLQLWLHILPRFTLTYILFIGHAVVQGRGVAAIKGWFGSLHLLPHAIRERRRIQSTRKVSADYIDSIILHDIPPEQTGLRKFRAVFTGKP